MKLSSARFDMENSRLERPTLKNYGETVVGGSVGTNANVNHLVNIASGNVHNLILTNPITAFRFSSPQAIGSSVSITLILRQDAMGNRKVSWPDSVWWPNNTAPTLATSSWSSDTFEFFTIDGGNIWYGGMVMAGSSNLGKLWSFGYGNLGGLGNGVAGNKSSPVQVGSLTNWAIADGGSNHSLALKTNGTLWSFGYNRNGGLGDGTTTNKSSPVQVGALTNWANISCGHSHSLAVKTDGTLWSFGKNSLYGAPTLGGQLGDGTKLNRSSPVQIGALTNWARVSGGWYHSLAIKTNGTLWSFGYNNSGELGDGTAIYRSSPVQVGALADWALVSAGNRHSFAIKTDGTLWAFGQNTSGRLGDGTTVSRNSPVQIGSLTNWASIASGNSQSLALKTDGTLWSFGLNNVGQLGDGTTINKSSPVQIGSLTSWTAVSRGDSHFLALKTDGTLWSFGINGAGQLGDGTTINRSSPVQVGSLTNWIALAKSGRYHSLVIARN